MSLIDPSRIFNNLVALAVIAWIFFMIYSKMDKARVRDTIERLKGLFGGKKE